MDSQLDKSASIEVERILTETEMDAELDVLINELAGLPEQKISAADINKEIKAIRQTVS